MTLALRQVHVGDCRALLAQMDDESVNCVVTSPPYWGLRDYGTGTWEGGDEACDHRESSESRTEASRAASTLGGSTETVHASHVFRGKCGKCGADRVDRQLGLEATPEEFVANMMGVFRDVRRVLRSDGTFWLNIGDSYAAGKCGRDDEDEANLRRRFEEFGTDRPKAGRKGANGKARKAPDGLKAKDLVGIPWMLAFALRADGWWLRSDIVWSKPNPMPESVQDRPTKAHEYIFLLTKSEKYWYDADAIREIQSDGTHERFSKGHDSAADESADRKCAEPGSGIKNNTSFDAAMRTMKQPDGKRNKRSVWSIATEPYGGAHFATFPKKLVEPCILAGCPAGGVVLDPFGGSGTVGEVAEALGRNWILLELSEEYAALARKRVSQRGLFVEAI